MGHLTVHASQEMMTVSIRSLQRVYAHPGRLSEDDRLCMVIDDGVAVLAGNDGKSIAGDAL